MIFLQWDADMADLYQFIAENALLCTAFLLALVLFIKSDHPFFSGVTLVEPGDVVNLVNDDALLVDLRDEALYLSGHITQAKPFSEFEQDTLKEGKKIILYAQKGHEAQQKATGLRRKHPNVQFFVLQGGLDAWVEAGFPVVKR